jgi:hypothetical protein
VVELLDRADQPDRALLDEIEERQPLVAVALGDRHDQAQVRAGHVVLRLEVAPLDALGERDLLVGGQQRGLRDAVEELLEPVEGRVSGRLRGEGIRAHGRQATTAS